MLMAGVFRSADYVQLDSTFLTPLQPLLQSAYLAVLGNTPTCRVHPHRTLAKHALL